MTLLKGQAGILKIEKSSPEDPSKGYCDDAEMDLATSYVLHGVQMHKYPQTAQPNKQ